MIAKLTIDDAPALQDLLERCLIAFAHVTRDCPKPSEWWIALLVLDPSQRGRGLGAEIHDEIVEWVAAQGGAALWLAVQTQNERAEKFWLRQGYVDRGRQASVAGSGLKGTVILMSKALRC